VWRAATRVASEDLRPTGVRQLPKAARVWQRRLDSLVAGDQAPAVQEWGRLLSQVSPSVAKDVFRSTLAERLAAISRSGVDARHLLRSASAGGPLPDDHAAGALWWRINRKLTPAAARVDSGDILAPGWPARLAELVGRDRAQALKSSPWWPSLVNAVDHALRRGWRRDDLLHGAATPQEGAVDEGQTLVWRISLLADPVPDDDLYEPRFEHGRADPWQQTEPSVGTTVNVGAQSEALTGPIGTAEAVLGDTQAGKWVEPDLGVAALIREAVGPPEQIDADVDGMFTRALTWLECPVSRGRMIEINQLTLACFRSQFPSSWGQAYLTDRFGQDLIEDPRFRPGQAPADWTGLVTHLRSRGVTEEEMIAAGVATVASTGRLIDRFRDRIVFPIMNNQDIVGFVGRRHPDRTDTDRGGPKYLNTADTPLFHKGAQLFGVVEDHLADGGRPVIVEGPMDAIAVTLASGGRFVGVAPLGTSLTEEQAGQLARIGGNPVVATDADIAGRVAAERHFWMLTVYRLDPLYAQLPQGSDPADLLARQGPTALIAALERARPLGDLLVDERLTHLSPDQAQLEAGRVIAARPAARWDEGSRTISARLHVPLAAVRHMLLGQVKEWNDDPRSAARKPLQGVNDVEVRLARAARVLPQQRWAALAGQLDPRLCNQGDWPALAQLMESLHNQGNDVAAITRNLVSSTPLTELPAQDLRYRLVAHPTLGADLEPFPIDTSAAKTTTHSRQRREAPVASAATTRTPPR
jgi:DNA primase catalytic core